MFKLTIYHPLLGYLMSNINIGSKLQGITYRTDFYLCQKGDKKSLHFRQDGRHRSGLNSGLNYIQEGSKCLYESQ